MRKLRVALITICFLACPSLYGQTTAKKKAGPTVQQLQQQVIDLQGQLLACQGAVKAATPDPMKDALEDLPDLQQHGRAMGVMAS